MITSSTLVFIFWSLLKPRQKTTTSMLRPCLLLFFLTLQKTMISLPTYCCFLQLKKKQTNTENQKKTTSLPFLQPKKKNLNVGSFWVARNDDRPPNLSSSLNIFSSLVKDDDELGGSSLFLSFLP